MPVAHFHAGQRPQNQLGIIATHAKTQPHMAQLQLLGQVFIACGDTAHQHIPAPAGVFGQGMD